jgi:DNA-binding transcriptional ArsR family regulator
MPATGGAELARLAGLLADDTRAEMCLALLDGRAWTAGELARHAGVAASTATGHLNRLIAGGLLTEQRQGRHRYIQLAGAHVAQLLEDLTAHFTPVNTPAHSLRAATASAALARARTCYDHLAGRLGVEITTAMTGAGLIAHGFALTDGVALTESGLTWLTSALAVDPALLRDSRRPLIRSCLDWTERRPHLAGQVGALICQRFLDQRWIVRIGTGRAVRLTPAGQDAVIEVFGVDPVRL